ncbi:uncharacterized protein EV422DRAFT_512508 [Fimicolochytrium jonesii]|uniref:uncharacterized protein n=1 Tax=Fimicolochytrium jonesii TaxID=1396493 RepID=UPI0022FE7853|nr:uncharacterized protein EV422DRAFT_512508 [Fimicolochytrium jonesii]KAI8827062.1 hypothetical protein EV422DRAFT_512508 [Fimicolochytrium jonesii]
MRDPALVALQHKLPFLPGYQFDLEKARHNERKSHAFDYTNGVAVNKAAPGIGGIPLPGQQESKIHTSIDVYPQSNDASDGVPSWVAFDRKVLRFYAYFQEAVHEKREEQYRVRKVNIYFYLEDDSVHVSEPRTVNSGIPQGTLLRRHRIPKPDSEIGQHYTVSDFNVGNEVTFYSRTFKIIGCDKFTKDFLNRIGVAVPPAGSFPTDPYTLHRQELASRMKATRPRPPQTSLKKFLENDRRVLRFFCVWDDTQSVFGDLRHMVVHYYLSDDTVEIREHIPANAGRDANTLFLRRSKLPKRMPVTLYGQPDAHLNEGDYFNERDFLIGAVLHLYGRPFIVCDCDEFTREYYNQKYGIETFDPVRIEDYEPVPEQPLIPASAVAANYELLLPPSPLTPANTTTATLSRAAIPMIGTAIAPKTDFQKLMLYDTTTLRFSAKMNSPRQVDKDRTFVVSLYVADDTISVFEPKSRNTGLMGGKFLEKGRIRKPDGSGLYTTQDFAIGEQLVFFHHPFIITGADDFAIKFMGEHPDMFPKHNADAIAGQIAAGAAQPVAKPPTPGPALHDWQEEILVRGEPLPVSQPGVGPASIVDVTQTETSAEPTWKGPEDVLARLRNFNLEEQPGQGVATSQNAYTRQNGFAQDTDFGGNAFGHNAAVASQQQQQQPTENVWRKNPEGAAADILSQLRNGTDTNTGGTYTHPPAQLSYQPYAPSGGHQQYTASQTTANPTAFATSAWESLRNAPETAAVDGNAAPAQRPREAASGAKPAQKHVSFTIGGDSAPQRQRDGSGARHAAFGSEGTQGRAYVTTTRVPAGGKPSANAFAGGKGMPDLPPLPTTNQFGTRTNAALAAQ